MFRLIILLLKLINPLYWIMWMIKGGLVILKILPALLIIIPILLMIALVGVMVVYIAPVILLGGIGFLVYKKFLFQES